MESKNQDLLAEVDRLKKETEELRLRRGRTEEVPRPASEFKPSVVLNSTLSVGVKHQDSQNSFLAFLNAPTSALDQFDVSSSSETRTHTLSCLFFILFCSDECSSFFLASFTGSSGLLLFILIFFNRVLGRRKFVGVCVCSSGDQRRSVQRFCINNVKEESTNSAKNVSFLLLNNVKRPNSCYL